MTGKTKSIIKYAFALTLLGVILHSAGTEKIIGYLKQISPLNWLLALTFATLSQLISALRMRFFFRASGFHMNKHYAVVLYYVGAFYNFLLPGGVGGDAYKVVLVRNHLEMPTMQGVRIMLADRASGLCVILMIMFAALSQIDFSRTIAYANAWVAAAAIITLVAYVVFSEWLLKQKPRAMLGSLFYSLAAQGLWIATLAAIWASIGDGTHLLHYVVFYCAASITGMLPISVGGLGVKEMTYYYGAEWMKRFADVAVSPELGVALSLCLFAMMFLASLPGLLWLEKVVKTKHL